MSNGHRIEEKRKRDVIRNQKKIFGEEKRSWGEEQKEREQMIEECKKGGK